MAACEAAARDLQTAAIAPEALAEYVPPRRVLLFPRPAKMVPIGEVWRLGTLLLGTDATLYALGRATRAAERGRPGYQSLSREERREIAAAALRGGYPVGTPVNYDARELDLSPAGLAELRGDATAPIGVEDSAARVRWRAGASLQGAPELHDYLRERIALLAPSE